MGKIDLQEILRHWESPEVESLRDKNLRMLEIESINSSIMELVDSHGNLSLADFGCGDGFDTEMFGKLFAMSNGYDYSKEMLSRAKTRESTTLSFRKLDLLVDQIDSKFDVAISKRCIINLGDEVTQFESLAKISDSIKSGGWFFLLECFVDGLANLNSLRASAQLPELSQPFHNNYLQRHKLVEFCVGKLEIVRIVDFSTYYFLTRVISEYFTPADLTEFDSNSKDVARDIDILQGEFIGPQTLYCLRKY